ncbi:MAG: hypothetical protein ACJA2S_002954 [Cyclobacteriaceae bacterium]|jgi:hypothetical protein
MNRKLSQAGLKIIIVLTVGFWIIESAFARQDVPKFKHIVYLIGNTGTPENAPYNFKLLKEQLSKAPKDASLIFLGDILYPNGMPSTNHPKRKIQEAKLIPQLDLIKSFKGKSFMVPGDRDWHKGGANGWDHIRFEEEFIEDYLDDEDVFLPKAGYPGPVEVKLDKGVYLILFDFQWMIHRWNKPLQDHPLETHNEFDVLVEISDLLEKHKNHHVILASHHPIISYGAYGGNFSFKQHVFPLTDVDKSLYLPLPGVGSLYPIFRSTAGGRQDIANPKYKSISLALEELLKQYDNAVYVAGHEESLQHIKKEGVNYIVSGTGSQASFVKKGKYSEFASSRTGFSKINYSKSGQSDLEFWVADDEAPEGEKVYESLLYKREVFEGNEFDFERDYLENKSTKIAASDQYSASAMKKVLLGVNYRDVWKEEVEVDVFDIKKQKGGLTPIQLGGGLQTKSLRLEAKDGKQYVIRSVEKYAEKALPRYLRKTVAATILQDQISASHPYAALIVPPMAEAVGVYHTNPKLYYIPNDSAFGKYQQIFANAMVLFEERPDGDWSDAAHFGNSKNVTSSPKVLKKLKKDHDNTVDQHFVLKSRMFDMIIADWDRHEDQWRWASYDNEEGKLYRPIPRDRDQAMFMNEGILPKIASRKWAVPKVEGFNDEIRWSPGFNFNAKYFDRSFLTNLSKEDWLKTVQQVQNNLTDQIIEKAITEWPQGIQKLSGAKTIGILKARRDNLKAAALELYYYLAEQVEVFGSDKKEFILIEKINPEELKVTLKKVSKKGAIQQILYERTFYAEETNEVRIYGHGGDDIFQITGDDSNKIKVRIIGGDGDDQIVDKSEKSTSKRILVYDNKSTVITAAETKIKSKTSDKPDINRYDKYGFIYDNLMPLGYWKVNPDDGIFLGGGFILTKFKWRKKPFASKHTLTGDFSVATKAFNINYEGTYTDIISKWDLDLLTNIQAPFSVDNFFGLGNESNYDFENQPIDYYRARFENNLFRAALSHPIGSFAKFSIGAQHQGFEIENRTGRFLDQSDAGGLNTQDLFQNRRFYTGLYTGLQFDSRDNLLLTTRGVFWNNEFVSAKGLNDLSSDLNKFSSELSLYYSFKYPNVVTLASRTGMAHNFGEFEFYNANKLGGISNLRGFRRTRFYGQTSFYQNFDLRIRLFNVKSYLLPGSIGILGFYDVGRVWLEGEQSDKWHKGAGGGIWISPLGKAVLSFNLAFTEEETLPFVGLGFFF